MYHNPVALINDRHGQIDGNANLAIGKILMAASESDWYIFL